ncbi:MAG TPA: PilZ domain-containing protein [Nitrospira sp.]
MTRRSYTRRQSRRALIWRVFYGGGELIGQGSIVDVHENGCRVAGCMPVEVGTHLRLCIWPTDSPTDILVVQGTVRWARGLEFGLFLATPMPTLDQLGCQRQQDAHASSDLANPSYNPVGGRSEKDA